MLDSRKQFGLDSSAIALPTFHEKSGRFGATRMSSSEGTLWISCHGLQNLRGSATEHS